MKNEAGFRAQHGDSKETQTAQPDTIERSEFQVIADQLGSLVTQKNAAYGSAYIKAGLFLQILFPAGIHPHRYADALLAVRIFDKLMRLATRPDAFGESPYHDIAGYGILGVHKDSQYEGKKPKDEDTVCVGEKV